MFLELAEALDCPECRSSVGLVAFVEESEDRRVHRGWLGCPLCEVRYAIAGGSIDFGPATPESGKEAGAPPCTPPMPRGRTAVPPDAAMRLAALLHATEPRGVLVLLGPGLAEHAPELARAGERIEVLAWFEDPGSVAASVSSDDLAAGVDPMYGGSWDRWPIRTGSLGGIALLGPIGQDLLEAERCARQGSRLVVLGPGPADLESLASAGFEELARDEITWVGERR